MKIVKETDKWIYYLDDYGRQKKKPKGQEGTGKDEIDGYFNSLIRLAKANAHLKNVDSLTEYMVRIIKSKDKLSEEQTSKLEVIRTMRDEQERYNPNVHEI